MSSNAPLCETSICWALKNVSFTIHQGEVVGLIGQNGAGKSVLLKILSNIAKPTSGFAKYYGKLGAMLEVGTGFHRELTGKENIYLSGAVLGMKKSEIDKKLEQIIAFSEIEPYLDFPVKRYSSGMCVRLAFAIFAQLEPEIMFIDEVMSVGDEAFKEKCIQSIKHMAFKGRTIILVSHDMDKIIALCKRAIYLAEGQIVMDGPTEEVVACYLENTKLSLYKKLN
jgi:lipopolysaccharide transport system ATP-binding protein